jgi:hypothetical protein
MCTETKDSYEIGTAQRNKERGRCNEKAGVVHGGNQIKTSFYMVLQKLTETNVGAL